MDELGKPNGRGEPRITSLDNILMISVRRSPFEYLRKAKKTHLSEGPNWSKSFRKIAVEPCA